MIWDGSDDEVIWLPLVRKATIFFFCMVSPDRWCTTSGCSWYREGYFQMIERCAYLDPHCSFPNEDILWTAYNSEYKTDFFLWTALLNDRDNLMPGRVQTWQMPYVKGSCFGTSIHFNNVEVWHSRYRHNFKSVSALRFKAHTVMGRFRGWFASV